MAMRYPKGGKGRRWTVKELEALGAAAKGDTLADGDGLSGEVRIASDGAASVRWRMAFKWEGAVRWHQCGTWPTTGMEAIRTERDKARSLLKDGVHPGQERKAAKIEAQRQVEATLADAARQAAEKRPWRDMFDAWLSDGVARADGNAELRRSFDKDLLPRLGSKPVKTVTDTDLREALRMVGRERGRGRMAEVLAADVRQMYKWAIRRQPWRGLLPDGNPAELLEDAQVLPIGYVATVGDRVLSPAELRELRDRLQDLEDARGAAAVGQKYQTAQPIKREVQHALWIALGTACRIGELLQARWEHVDLDAGEWFVPAADTKTKVDWLVFLSPFVQQHFKALHALTGHSAWCFPAKPKGRAREGTQQQADAHVDLKSVTKQVGDRQVRFMKRTKPLRGRRNDDALVLASGENGAWSPHDLRRTAATMMQALRVPLDVVDRCQNHVLAGSKVRRPYLLHEYAQEKREAWEKLGERIEAILAADNVIPMPARVARSP